MVLVIAPNLLCLSSNVRFAALIIDTTVTMTTVIVVVVYSDGWARCEFRFSFFTVQIIIEERYVVMLKKINICFYFDYNNYLKFH